METNKSSSASPPVQLLFKIEAPKTSKMVAAISWDLEGQDEVNGDDLTRLPPAFFSVSH